MQMDRDRKRKFGETAEEVKDNTSSTPRETPKTQEFKLDPESELRFEVEGKHEKVLLEVKNGMAELFGTELVKGKTYTFIGGAKVAVFTWQGCTIEIQGRTEVAYVAKETPMMIYLNTHWALEQMRKKAETDNTRGPVCIIVGPTDVGKSTLCKLLINYAVRMGRKPIYVDLDVGQGNIAIPGTIAALPIERPADPMEGFIQLAPLVYHYGHKEPGSNTTLYQRLVTQLAESVAEKMDANKKVRASGAIINTCGWVKGQGYRLLIRAAQAFKVDAVIVLDQERLYNELVRDLPNKVRVVFQPKSGGVVERNRHIRAEGRDQRVREYFYGTTHNFFPHSVEVKYHDLKIYKIGAPALPDSCMPLGMKAEDNMTKLVTVQPGPSLLNHILALSTAEAADANVINSSLLGFLCVTNVDHERQSLTLLSAQPRPLPKTLMLLSDVQFLDTQ